VKKYISQTFDKIKIIYDSDSIIFIENSLGTEYRIFIQEINLNKVRSVKIQVGDLREPSKNLWVCLVLLMEDMEPTLYLIPSQVLTNPDDFIFKYNKLDEPFEHLSNYEIKVFRNGMEKLSEFAFENMIGELI